MSRYRGPVTARDVLGDALGFLYNGGEKKWLRFGTGSVCGFHKLGLENEWAGFLHCAYWVVERPRRERIAAVVTTAAPGFGSQPDLRLEKGLDKPFELCPAEVVKAVSQ